MFLSRIIITNDDIIRYRNPKDERLTEIANILNVSFNSIKKYDYNKPIDLIYTLMWLEELIPNYYINFSDVPNINELYIVTMLHNQRVLKLDINPMYMLRWRIEEYFRAKKQNYDFENFRIRSLKGINVLNKILTCVMLHNGILAEKINKKLLVIKIIEASKSLKNKLLVWYGQISSGIREILKRAHTGIKEWQNIEERKKFKQLELMNSSFKNGKNVKVVKNEF